MITDDACPYCQAWEFELGDVYPKTLEGKNFPILRIPIDAPLTSYSLNSSPAVGTPTFIFIQNKNEIGRIEGFTDAEMFWWLVEDILNGVR